MTLFLAEGIIFSLDRCLLIGDPIIGRVWLIMRVSAGKIKKEREGQDR
jgi:hypothetical protein